MRNPKLGETIKSNTLNDFLNFAEQRLKNSGLYFGHGTNNAYDEALAIAQFIFNFQNITELTHKLNDKQIEEGLELLEKRIQTKKPLAYLTHKTNFANLEFFVDERVLIPRSPIAELILNGFNFINTPIKNALDLCCGSGCIGLALAYYYPIKTTLSDLSLDALEVAKINEKNLKRQNKLLKTEIIQSDLFKNIDTKFDLIISNPPYVSNKEYQSLPTEYFFEPKEALFAKNKGMKIISKILKNSCKYLNDNGFLIMEVGNSETEVLKKYPTENLIWLEFENGGDGVFAISKKDLIKLAAL